MSNIDKRSFRADGGDIGSGRIRDIADNPYGDEEKCWLAKRVLALLDENDNLLREKDAMEAAALAMRDDMRDAREKLEAKDSTIATQQQEIRTLLNALGQASEKRNAEQADIIAKQEKWIKDIEATMITATDRAEAAEKRIADQLGIIASARKFISEYAGFGDVGAAEFIKIIDRSAGKGE